MENLQIISDISFTCRKCGELKNKEFFVKSINLKNGIDTICKKCKNELKYHLNNKESVAKANRKFHKTEKYKEYQKEYHKTEKYKIKARIRNRKYQKEIRENEPEKVREKANRQIHLLNDNYLFQKLKKNGFSKEQIKDNPELIELKRIIIKTKRLCKTLQNLETV